MWPLWIGATEVAELEEYLDGTRSLFGEFVQSTPDPRGGTGRESRGSVALQKPGRFRWDYKQPYEQTIVGDGERIWHYDADLDQVTVQPLNQSLGGTPLALLSGSQPVAEAFSIEPQEVAGGVEWFLFMPSSGDETSFESIRLALRDGVLVGLELKDALGQTTRMEFLALQRNVPIEPTLFDFVPPAGADVIGGDG